MTKQAVARWFNLCFEAQCADGSLKKLKSIQDTACQGHQLACKRNNDGRARRRDRGMLAHPRDRVAAAMEDAIMARVARSLSAQSRGRNWRDNRQDSGRPTWHCDNHRGCDFASSRPCGNDNRLEDRGRQGDLRSATHRFPPRGRDNGGRGGQRGRIGRSKHADCCPAEPHLQDA